MNSLNIISARVSPPSTPAPSRTNSYGGALGLSGALDARRSLQESKSELEKSVEEETVAEAPPDLPAVWQAEVIPNEKTPLLDSDDEDELLKTSGWRRLPSRIASAFVYSIRWVFSTLGAPGFYLIGLFYDHDGHFAPFRFSARKTSSSAKVQPLVSLDGSSESKGVLRRNSVKPKKVPAFSFGSSGLSSEDDSEREVSPSEGEKEDIPARNTRSKSLQEDETTPARRSIRIKLNNEDTMRQRKHRKTLSNSSQSDGLGGVSPVEATAAQLKSPTSPAASALTKYPRAPAPPRPLVPARATSYTFDPTVIDRTRKTLILDLDETLIHSMAKGGRMGSGHMVEVKLNTYIGVAGQAHVGPQHPILYYVHKRPFCDDFLRRVCKWYNLVVFTASVQEYADPVIDWLEAERKFFSGRFYRQHCTYRHGAFIKDLSSVEPDLSKVMILDNSPLSYMFHQDNAIPIEGWINDPTDNDLLHLVPLLEGLQYVTDVRALLALRGGEDGKHMTT